VNLVSHKSTSITRALKTIKKDLIPKEDEKKLFAEMNILRMLDHPNIIKLIELYQDDQHYYLITE
jgi:calcium-dependent protein kinase